MSNKSNKQSENEKQSATINLDEAVENDKTINKYDDIDRGTPELLELMLPSSFTRGKMDYMKVGDKYVRNFFVIGYPELVYVTGQRLLYDSDYNIDISLRIDPSDTAEQVEKLSHRITDKEIRLSDLQEQGKNRDIQLLERDIASLKKQLIELQINMNNAFTGQMSFFLLADSKKELDRQSKALKKELHGHKFKIGVADYQQDLAWKTTMPFGEAYIYDKQRNLDTGAIVGLFPYYNSHLSDPNGIYLGDNLITGTPATLDFFTNPKAANHNVVMMGESGSGKTTTLDAIIMRGAVEGIRSGIVDPEGEHQAIVECLHGANIELGTNSKQMINIFDLDVDEEIVHGRRQSTLDVKSKIVDVMQIMHTILPDLNPAQDASLNKAVQITYERLGFKDGDPMSLFVTDRNYGHKSGDDDVYYMENQKRNMPQLTDLVNTIDMMTANGKDYLELRDVRAELSVYTKGGSYDFLDCQTSPELQNYKDAPVICFDIHKLEGDRQLQEIGMNLALSWLWEHFIKKNQQVRKFVVVDEAWRVLQHGASGTSDLSGNYIENMSRRIRKRNGGLITASQSADEFVKTDYGKALVQNSDYKFYLRMKRLAINHLINLLGLTNGEANYLVTADKGVALIKVHEATYPVSIRLSPDELRLIGTNEAVQGRNLM